MEDQSPEGLSSWPICQAEMLPPSRAGGHWAAMAQTPRGSGSDPSPRQHPETLSPVWSLVGAVARLGATLCLGLLLCQAAGQ